MCTLGSDMDCGIPQSESLDDPSANTKESVTRECCGKCGVKDGRMITIHGRNVYCQTCFVTGSTHKFRSALGKHKAIRKNEFVLIGHSDKANSATLLHLIGTATKEPLHKKLIFQPIFLYIDDGAAKGHTIEERATAICAISKQVETHRLTGFLASLSSSLQEDISMNILQPMNQPNIALMINNAEKDDTRLSRLFQNLEDDTAKDELLRKMRRILLLRIASLLNCEKVLLADSSMDLAIKVLADTSTGRGAHISMDVAFLDDRSYQATILRPMRDFTQDEVTWYSKLFATASPSARSKDRGFPFSVRSVASNFLNRLDSEFHGTVAAIYRTSDKLVSAGCQRRNQQANFLPTPPGRCALCDNPIQSDRNGSPHCQLSAIQATAFSKLTSSYSVLSQSPTISNTDQISHCSSSTQSCLCNTASSPLSEKHMEHHLCYGCKNIFRCSSPRLVNELNSLLTPIIRRSINRDRMLADISSFLL